MTTISDQIRALAARPTGMSSADVSGCTTHQASWAACKLARRGEVHGVKISPRCIRYFSDPELADAFSERIRKQGFSLNGFNDTPASQAAQFKPADPIAGYHPDFKHTYCPSFEPRWEMQPLPLTAHNGAQRGVVINEACHA